MGGMAGKLAMTLSSGLDFVGMGAFTGASGLTGSESDGTQLLTAPADAPGTWTADEVTRTANAVLAPDGTTTATSVIENTGSLYHRIRVSLGDIGSTGTFTFSAYLKPAGRRYIEIHVQNGPEVYAIYDLQTGVVSTSGTNGGFGTLTSTAIAVGANGYYKCTIVYSTSNTFTDIIVAAQTSASFAIGGQHYTGDGASGFYFWRPKLTQP